MDCRYLTFERCLEAADADYRITSVVPRGMSVRLEVHGAPGSGPGRQGRGQEAPVRLEVGVPGRHNALNAAAAYATVLELGLPAVRARQAASGLAAYQGARRRMEPKGEAGGITVLDSYAHHPTELAADLRAARDIVPGGRVIAVFQPHLFSRTRIFASQFGAALGLADEVFVLDVYAAREDPEPGVTGELVARAVPGGRAAFLPDAAAVPGAVADTARPGDLILTMGAGDVTAQGPLIVAALRARAGTPG
jgi:UDP-N-acetylmuramate--alanine ligase